ncbi:uncharacterized protein LOC128674951 isoform X3 [Plodia interpunctella]|uniref:uncharacterized protein LOC128674951 isoform X3 n=1 Tax=Plodia interpunctella TaxID=58824 RepID=UPI002368896B|nr:uncharacterized protein LOC128674951 isoform X3 [Plodia interpunctella]
MRSFSGVLAVSITALLVSCSADPHQEAEVSGSEHISGDRYDGTDYNRKEEMEDFLRFLARYEAIDRNLNGIGGSSILGRNLNGIGGSSILGRNIDGIGGSSLVGRNLGLGGTSLLQGRNLHGIGGSGLAGRNLNGVGGSSLLGRRIEGESRYSRFLDSLGGGNLVRNLDSLGGGNLVRNLDSLGGGNLVRNLDSIGGANMVKKNLDQLGGPNLVKRTLDSLGGGNLVRNLDSLGGGNLVRELDSIGGGHKPRNLDPLGGGNLVREVRESKHYGFVPYLMTRRYDYGSPYGGGAKREPWLSAQYPGYYGDGLPKRNFDEIDRSGLDNFVKKRNFDEIDQTSMPFPYASKRFYHLYGSNQLDSDAPVSSFDKKRFRPDYPMDEIDLSHFPIGSKRSQDSFRPLR